MNTTDRYNMRRPRGITGVVPAMALRGLAACLMIGQASKDSRVMPRITRFARIWFGGKYVEVEHYLTCVRIV